MIITILTDTGKDFDQLPLGVCLQIAINVHNFYTATINNYALGIELG